MIRKARMLALIAVGALIAATVLLLAEREDAPRAAAPSTTDAPAAPVGTTPPRERSVTASRTAPAAQPSCGPLQTTGAVILRREPSDTSLADGFGFGPDAVVRCLEQGTGAAARWYCVLAVVDEERRRLLEPRLRSGWVHASAVRPAGETADVGDEPIGDVGELCHGRPAGR